MPENIPNASEETRRAVAEILAAGVRRYQHRLRLAGTPRLESRENSLDVCAETRLHVPTYSGGERPQRTGEGQEP